MISVEEANRIIQSSLIDFGVEEIPLEFTMGRILREDIRADRDFPPYDRVTMDGIAIQYEDYDNGERTFEIAGIASAGSPQKIIEPSGTCLEVMTGSIMPVGLDTVIRYEDLVIEDGLAKVMIETVREKQNIHFKGQDGQANDLILHSGKRLSSSEIGVCATIGKSKVSVSRMPKVMIISTGNELVNINEKPEPHQIRKSNVHRLKAMLEECKLNTDIDHIDDDYEQITERLKRHLETYDVLLLSGGVSMGKFDHLPKALEELGVTKLFHKIAQRPGKPLWLGRKDSTMVFAFPGNPVSSFMCANQYFRPWLEGSIRSESTHQIFAKLTDNVVFKTDLTYFMVVKITYSEKGEVLATPLAGNGSGDLTNLVHGDAFIELPRGKEEFKKDDAYRLIIYR